MRMYRFLKRALNPRLCITPDDLPSYLCSSQARSAAVGRTGHRSVQKGSSQEQEEQPPQGYWLKGSHTAKGSPNSGEERKTRAWRMLEKRSGREAHDSRYGSEYRQNMPWCGLCT